MGSMKLPFLPSTAALSSDPTVVIYGGPSRRAAQEVPVDSTGAARSSYSVVVGVDGSQRSRDALALAATLAEPDQHILLAHVLAYQHGDARSLIRDVVDATFDASREILDPAIKREMRLVDNVSVSAGLDELATSTAAAQLIVGSSRGERVGRRPAGSVAETLLSGSLVPVAVAPDGYSDGDRALGVIGCAVDGSPPSLVALAWAARLARRRRAPLRVFAIHAPIAFGGLSTTGAFGYRSATETAERDLEARIRMATEAHGVVHKRDFLHGDPVAKLVEASAEVGLLVMGSRSRGRIRSVLLGSVTRSLVHSAACPVVVVPNSGSPPSAGLPQRRGPRWSARSPEIA
jgi:nucleotide-binding universal stress UspA family protein